MQHSTWAAGTPSGLLAWTLLQQVGTILPRRSPCPPGQPNSSLCHETNVITFNGSGTNSILSSNLASNIQPIGTAGWVGLDLTLTSTPTQPHDLNPSNNGNVFTGLPVTGFEAVNFVTGDSGGSILSNYSGAYRHRISRLCANGGGACS